MIKIVLYIISILLACILLPIGLIFGFFASWHKHKLSYAVKKLTAKLLRMAMAIDCYGNVVCEELFEATLVKPETEKHFGNRKETISSVIGKNEEAKTLSMAGAALCDILDLFQKNHSKNSIDLNI